MSRRLPFVLIGLAIVGLVVLLVVAGALLPQKLQKTILPPKGSNPRPPAAGPNWTWLNETPSPMSNASMMAYFPNAGEIILLDSNRTCTRSSTWTFSGGNWQNLTAEVGAAPDPARELGGLVYDSRTGSLVLFGGESPCGVYDDTWTFANNSWTHVSASNQPPPLYGFAMTYDYS